MKALVLYYSHTGNNAWLAKKIAETLRSDIEPIAPRMNLLPFLILFSLLKKSPGVKRIAHKVEDYDAIFLVGPIWMGQLIFPLRNVIKKYGKQIKKLYFVTCCGSDEDKKDDKFGYGNVFGQVRQLAGDKCVHCEAFSISLVLPENLRDDSKAMMEVRLSDDNFTGPIREKFNCFIQLVSGAGDG
jgi:multimeric flavodoxin WrbA